MIDYKTLYFYLFGRIADVIEEYETTKEFQPLVKKLIQIELEAEDMYMDMPSEEDEVTEE